MQTRNANALTPREREAFDLLRRGLTNEEIARTMGISVDGAKYHVSQILSKLAVATREEAAALPAEAAGTSRRWLGLALGWKLAAVVTVILATLGLAALAWAIVSTTREDSGLASGSTPTAIASECPDEPGGFQVSWVNFVRLEGIFYQSLEPPGVSGVRLGQQHGTVRCKLDGYQQVAGRQLDGDAAYLEPGTVLFEVAGYNPAFRLGMMREGEIVLYEADLNANARVGRDLLDIEGKVTYIGIASPVDTVTELGTITDSEQVRRLVELVSAAPVDQTYRDQGEADYFVVFHLIDGSPAVRRAYWLSSGELSRGITLPDEFQQAVEAAIAGS